MSDKKNEKPVVIDLKKPVAESKPVAVIESKPAVKPAEAAPAAQTLPQPITRRGVGQIGVTYYVTCGEQLLGFEIPDLPEFRDADGAPKQVSITVGQSSKKWLGQNGGYDLRMTVYRNEGAVRGTVVVMPHGDGVMVHAYPDQRRSYIYVHKVWN